MFLNLVWDLDGTLFDTYPAIVRSIQDALHDFGRDAARAHIEQLALVSLDSCMSALADETGLSAEDLSGTFAQHYAAVKPEQQPPFPGALSVCEHILNVRGKNVIVTHRRRHGTEMLLAAHHLQQYFAGCLTGDDGYPRKPDPAAFNAALELYGLQRDQTVAVGDRDLDILAGQAAGLFTCRFGADSRGVVADLTVRDFYALRSFLAQPLRGQAAAS